jgi:hypothetical protein
MLHRFIVAIGAGCAAALLFAVGAQSSLLAMTLACLAPLPIMISTLGWGVDAGAVAAATSVGAIALLAVLAPVVEPLSDLLLFVVTVAAPAWALAAFAVAPIARLFGARRAEWPVHASVGAIVSLASLIGILASAAVLATREGASEVSAAIAAITAEAYDSAPDGLTARAFAETLARFVPLAIAASSLLMLCVNLYAAARATQLSHNLPRPWPDVPATLILPWPLGVAFLACVAAAYALPAPAAQYFSIGAGGLGGALALQGLAVAHALSRGLKMRPLMLVALYACCVLRAKYTLPVLAGLGVIDGFLKLRARAALVPAPTSTGHK